MRDVFYTILVVWIIWRVLTSVNNMRSRNNPTAPPPEQPSAPRQDAGTARKRMADNEGEYVDYEDIK